MKLSKKTRAMVALLVYLYQPATQEIVVNGTSSFKMNSAAVMATIVAF